MYTARQLLQAHGCPGPEGLIVKLCKTNCSTVDLLWIVYKTDNGGTYYTNPTQTQPNRTQMHL